MAPTLADIGNIAAIIIFGLALVAFVLGPLYAEHLIAYIRWAWRIIRGRRLPYTRTSWTPSTAYMTPETYDRIADAAALTAERDGTTFGGLRIVATDYAPPDKVLVVDAATAARAFDLALEDIITDTALMRDIPSPFDLYLMRAMARDRLRPDGQARPFDWRTDF